MAEKSSSPRNLEKEMAALQEEFGILLRERKQLIEDLMASLDGGGAEDKIFEDLRIVVHKLAGSCAMYGYPSLGGIARECQTRLHEDAASLADAPEKLHHLMNGLLEALRKSIEAGPGATI